MAGSKLTPRQKMINMMYLVLTALLALNVSKEIINAFITLDEGIEISNQNISSKNKATMDAFRVAMDADAVKAKPHFERAQKSEKMSADLVKFIEDTKNEIIRKAEALEQNAKLPTPREIKKNDDYDTPTTIMVGDKNDGRGHKASELKNKLDDFKKSMVANLDANDRALFKNRFEVLLNTKDPDPSSEIYKREKKKTWEMANFYHTPVVAALAMLSKIQSDVKTAESEIGVHLLSRINAKDLKFTDVVAKVVAPTSYVLTGQEYTADVFLAAFNANTDAEIFVGGNKLSVEGGMGKYVDKPGSEGVKKWGGVIKVKDPTDPTKFKEYPFEAEYIAARPAAVVSPTKMNVIYIGVENPISISVPGVPNNKVIASASGGGLTLSRVSGGSGEQYIGKATTQGEATINITADLDGKKMNMGAQKFRIKRVPDPVAMVANSKGGPINKNILAAQAAVIPIMEAFDFELYFKVKSFKITIVRRGRDPIEISSESNAITGSMKEAIMGSPLGTKVYFEYIKASGPDGTVRSLNPLNFVVN